MTLVYCPNCNTAYHADDPETKAVTCSNDNCSVLTFDGLQQTKD